jgi:hypothetical protein
MTRNELSEAAEPPVSKATGAEEGRGSKRALCLSLAAGIVGTLRRSNAAWAERTGEPSTVSEWEYVKAQDEIEAKLLKLAGLDKERRATQPAATLGSDSSGSAAGGGMLR